MERFNRNNIILKTISAIAVLIVFCSVFFTVCSQLSKNTVVIIEEENNDEEEINSEINEEFNVKNLYKYKGGQISDNETSGMLNFGWEDQNNYIILKNQKELYKVDYRYNFIHKIKNENEIFNGKLSPDGSKLVYMTKDENGNAFYILDINSEKTKPLYFTSTILACYSKFKWSAESGYITFVGYNNDRECKLYAYDIINDSSYEIKILSAELGFYVEDLEVLDNGRNVSMLCYFNKAYYFYSGEIQNGELIIDTAKTVKLTDGLILNSNLKQDYIFYIDYNNNLYKYKNGMDEPAKIAENISGFRISQDSKYIAYRKHFLKNSDISDIYAGKLTKHGVVNRKLIYKNLLYFSDMKWSPDNKKILIESYDYNDFTTNISNKYSLSNPNIYIKNGFGNEKSTIVVEFDDRENK